MWNLPNILSLIRLPLALLFFYDNIAVRSVVVIVAAASDCLDGYIARYYRQESSIGAILDPFTDKCFAACVMGVFWYEGALSFVECLALLCRDIAVLSYGLLLIWQRRLGCYRVRAIWSGKVTTCLQFALFLALLCGAFLPGWVYGLFVALGISAFLELLAVGSKKVTAESVD